MLIRVGYNWVSSELIHAIELTETTTENWLVEVSWGELANERTMKVAYRKQLDAQQAAQEMAIAANLDKVRDEHEATTDDETRPES